MTTKVLRQIRFFALRKHFKITTVSLNRRILEESNVKPPELILEGSGWNEIRGEARLWLHFRFMAVKSSHWN